MSWHREQRWKGPPAVSDYSDALVFLSDTITYLKDQDPKFSKRKLAEAVGLSASLLSMKLLGHRRMDLKLFRRVTAALPLSEKDGADAEALFLTGKGDRMEVRLAPILPLSPGLAKPDVYRYSDSSRYFLDFFNHWRSLRKGSLTEVSKQVGIHLTVLSKVLNGKKNPTLDVLDKIMPFFEISGEEEDYLRGIWLIGSDDDPKRRTQRFRSILAKAKETGKGIKSLRAYQYLSSWYYPVIRELLAGRGRLEDEFWIQKHLRFEVSLQEIRDSVKFLIEHGFLLVKGDEVSVAEAPIRAEGGVYRLTLMKYHESVLARSQEGLRKFAKSERHYLANTLTVGADDYERVVAIIREAQEKLGAIGERPRRASRVIQVVQNIFPVAEVKPYSGKNGGRK